MPLTKRVRPASHPTADPVNKRTTRSQSDIQAFARVSKPGASPADSKKRKASTQEVEEDVVTPKLASCKKLRRPRAAQRPISEALTDTPTKGARTLLADLDLSTPVKPLKLESVSDSTPSVVETPLTSPCSSSAPSFRDEKSTDDLPQNIQDLISLNSSFLSALSLHYAHNGTSSPVDLYTLAPSITKVWRKRKVTVDDVRRTLGVMQSSLSTDRPAPALKARTFYLSDYGRGKICLEQQESKKQRAKRTNSVMPQPIDEKALNALFERELNTRWVEYRCKISPNSKSPSSVSYFISQLPLAEITECASLAKVAPLFAKGQRRLEDLKAGAMHSRGGSNCFNGSVDPASSELEHARPAATRPLSSKASKAAISSHKKSASTSTAASSSTISSASDDAKSTRSSSSTTPLVASAPAPSRATSLLDRILAKQAAAAAAPAGPTPEARARKAALHRCEDVLATLSLLATTSGSSSMSSRVSFPFPRLVRDIQTSSRSPIGPEEVKKVVEVLASDIVPGYVSLMKMGTLEAVVVNKNQAVGNAEVRRRLVAAGAEEL
ncbi:DNA mismatch repair protein msh-2 [Lasiodiplodia theobromae]|uniref:DNA mismatch repair protein msh-2 n=1 Tax=Lasiodiplodia theobromae TaxID=45133 RepID=UPI0015C384C6|nr:DNA mismatch repair protein msh-2 [Lasiodiplodia theobromae]KAF4541137.1 DNA mismatch repair protein msh-2 [Lasiodiplodia theobromae]